MAAEPIQEHMKKLRGATEDWMIEATSNTKAGNEPKCIDVPGCLTAKLPTSLASSMLSQTLQALEARAVSIVGMQELATSELYTQTVPARLPHAPVKPHCSRLWQDGSRCATTATLSDEEITLADYARFGFAEPWFLAQPWLQEDIKLFVPEP